jgi:hypothetical protein
VEEQGTVTMAEESPETNPDLAEIDLQQIASPVLARLIEEVRNEEPSTINAYNRFHNRHNRSR